MAGWTASLVFEKQTSIAEHTVVNSTTIQTSVGSESTGMARIEKRNRL